jgi:hypothetical protein
MIPSVDAKYSSAWNEISARIQAREFIWTTFVSLCATLIGVAGGMNQSFIGVGIGFVALWAAMVSRHHDVIIRVLGDFQNELEHGNSTNKTPGWFPTGSRKASFQRKWRDYPQLILTILLTGCGLLLAYPMVKWTYKDARFWVWISSFTCGLFATGLIAFTHYERWKAARKL